MKELFKKLITDFLERPLPEVMERDYKIPLDSRKIVSLIGVRRSGKTYLLYYIISKLRDEIDNNLIVYINFEDDRLFSVTIKDLDDLIESYYELYPENRDRKVYFFFDEIQNIDGWEKFIRRIYDTLKIQVFLTGSSSKLLGSEIASALRGRTIRYEVFPYSFQEFTRHRKISVDLNSSRSTSLLKNAAIDYMTHGGFAEIIDEDPSLKRRIISDYLELIVFRDIVERHNIQNSALLKEFIYQLFSGFSMPLSVNKVYNDFKSRGFRVGKDTLYDYLMYLEDAFAVFTLTVESESLRERQRNPRKIYTVDTAFKTLFQYPGKDDYGQLFENCIFLHLRRQTPDIRYFRGKREVDFIVHAEGKRLIINAAYSLSRRETREREIQGLIEGMERLGEKQAVLVTVDEEELLSTSGKRISIIPMYKWLLSNPLQ